LVRARRELSRRRQELLQKLTGSADFCITPLARWLF
jgi:hypothetical protein